MYKFITLEEYERKYKKSHPKAVVNIEKTEVVLSCTYHGSGCSCLTHTQAVEHIADNWAQEEVE